ncbi:uncharacterized protein BJX67DRAFT_275159 [Aspergillus lucknowensis]|uniref:Uncharacterized protein n=1 Tax=Aspergillus lucknowensis TaxID=176173 RepID=A0ABR4LEF0_9EURO
MDSKGDTASMGKSLDKHTPIQGILSDLTKHPGGAERLEPIRDLQSCNCVKGDDGKTKRNIRDVADDSNSTVAAGVARPNPLTLSRENSSLASRRGRASQRTPSSPEYTAQRSPLQSHSPASLIFERNVQEDILLPQTSPSIPSHIRTENHIPPVLEASSAAITDNELDPDSVKIVTHSIHHPAAGCGTFAEQSPQPPCHDGDGLDMRDVEELPPASQSPDPNDIRRLSFISFADVVNAEHAESGDNLSNHDHFQKGATSPDPLTTVHRNMSSSPLYSPVSSHGFGTSPPTSISTSFKGLELSPNRGARATDSPLLAIQRPVSPSFSGELSIETMRQALRRTGSGDLGASRSQLSNTSSNDD